MNQIGKLGKVIHESIIWFCRGAIALCAVIIFADIVSRRLFGSSIMWAQRLATWSMVFLGFWGTGAYLWTKSHIGITFVRDKFRGGAQKAVDIFTALCIVAYSILILTSAVFYTNYLIQQGTRRQFGQLAVPFWPIMLFSAVLGSVALLVYAIVSFIRVINAKTTPAEATKPATAEAK